MNSKKIILGVFLISVVGFCKGAEKKPATSVSKKSPNAQNAPCPKAFPGTKAQCEDLQNRFGGLVLIQLKGGICEYGTFQQQGRTMLIQTHRGQVSYPTDLIQKITQLENCD